MRYWVYINDKVEGPFTEDKLVTLQGFTPDTLICSEDAANSGNQEWVKASTLFEFDQVEPQPTETAAPAPTTAAAAEPAAQTDALAAALLAKLDSLTNQLSDLQSKLDNVQLKLDESISAQQKASTEAAQRADALAAQVDSFVSTVHEEESVSPFEESNELSLDKESSPDELPEPEGFDVPSSIDLDAESETEHLSGKTEDDVVLNAALTSLHQKEMAPAPKEETSESTFQDLLTPETDATADNNQTQETQPQPEPTPEQQPGLNTEPQPQPTEESQKEAVLAQFSTPAAGEEVVDQVIKEKEAEKAQEKEKQSISQRLIAAGAAATSAVATFVGLKSFKNKSEQPENAPEKAEEKPVASAPETASDQNTPAVTSDESVTPAQAEVTPENATPVEQQPEISAQEPSSPVEPVAEPENIPVIPTLGDEDKVAAEAEKDTKEATMQELVPGAKMEQSDLLITEEDLKEAFAERSSTENQSVEQLFGLGSDTAQTEPAEQEVQPEKQNLPSLEPTGAENSQPAAEEAHSANPDELTEIELKEGSTYLISDFVPPASSDAIEQAYAKRDGREIPPAQQEQKNNAGKTDNLEIQEFVSTPKTIEQPQPEQPASKETEATVTVSQIILENTIKAKRGAALDIKTVPMVPEPAQSDRLQIDGLNDDINTQHDLKSADIQPAGKTAKMVVGLLIALLLAGVIYGMLGFMQLIPAKFNILASSEQTAEAEQQAQLDEMLDPSDPAAQEATPISLQDPAASQAQPSQQDIVLKEVQDYMLANGYTLKQYIEFKHPSMVDLITWNISNAVDPDTYSVLVKVPPENPQSFKTSYRFNYNAVSRALEPTISDARNLLNSVNQSMGR